MNFELDKQTIQDLEIFGNDKKHDSVFQIFNNTKTNGGKKRLHGFMQFPLSDLTKIQERCDAIKFVCKSDFKLTINSGQFDFIEHYLNLNISVLRNNFLDAYLQLITYKLKPMNAYYIIQSGIGQLIFLLKHLNEKIELLNDQILPAELNYQLQFIRNFISNPDIKQVTEAKEKISCVSLNRFDNLFRKKYRKETLEVINILYTLDAYISIAGVAKSRNFSFPEFLPDSKPELTITGLFHPLLENAVPYNIDVDETKNLCFLTGPNMAGKSTFMKAVGLAVYLSHLGFPVPAAKMETTVYNGMITTINLSDNMNQGYSHFYSEVRRVKEAALKIKECGKMFVIFDELFRGTNVKDAFDASLLIIKSFSKITDSSFFISTHITEIVEELKDKENIQFRYLDSELVNQKPVYSYKLLNGVSHERLGMLILRNEQIIDILNSISETNDLSNC